MNNILNSCSIPDRAKKYFSTPEWTGDKIPHAFFKEHNTKKGVWGMLNVISGEITYIICENNNQYLISQGESIVIKPQQLHYIRIDKYDNIQDIKIRIDFYK